MSFKRNQAAALTGIALAVSVLVGAAFNARGTVYAAGGAAQASPERSGRPRCTDAALKGDYGFTASGVTLPGSPVPPALQGPFASSGTATFDGQGNFTLTATNSFKGVLQGPVTLHGTYSVGEDCTYTSQAENGATFRSVIVGGGREIFILQTTPGVAITGTARRL